MRGQKPHGEPSRQILLYGPSGYVRIAPVSTKDAA
jgi:hypothetical protein